MSLSRKINLYTQSGQGIEGRKVLAYEAGYQIEQPNDLITREYVDPMQAMLQELLPPDAESLHNKVLVMAGTVLKSGYLAASPTATYETDKPAGASVTYIINDPTFTLTTPNTSVAVNQGDKGTLQLWLNGAMVDELDLAARFNESERDGAQSGLPVSSTGGLITVTSIEKYAITLYQKLNAFVSISAAQLREGFNSVWLLHVGTNGGDQESAVFGVFYDVGTQTPSVNGVDVAPQTVNPKWLSGVQYAGLGSTVLLDAVGSALYDNTYVLDPLTVSGLHGASVTAIAPQDSAVTGLSNPPAVGETMTVTGKVIALTVANQATLDALATVTPKDPHGVYATARSASKKLLVNTFGVRSTATLEHFDDESYRLPATWDGNDTTSSITGRWDSAALLPTGAAQQGVIENNENGLLYPSEDFTAFTPTNTANYSGRSGDVIYLRAFLAASPKSSIQLVLYGVAAGIGALGAADVNVEVKLPTQTGWLDCAKPFDGSVGVASDGNGAMVGTISYNGGNATLNVTFGGKSSYDANQRVLVRITLRNANRTIKQISTNW